jgi:hypothetical protein
MYYSIPECRRIFYSVILITATLFSQAQPYVNGNLSTGVFAANGTVAPSGSTWSQVQSPNTSLGFLVSTTSNISAVDDFTIPPGEIWNINSFKCYGYCAGYSGANPPYNDLRLQIFSSDPSSGTAVPVFGNLTTNRFSGCTSAQIYRINNTVNTSRLIYATTANISVSLNPGHYWIEWQIGAATGITGNGTPPSTVAGTFTQPGNNAKIHNISMGTWSDLVDAGSQARQDFPFTLNYSVTIPPACSGMPDPGNTLSSSAVVCSGESFSLSLQNNPLVSGLSFQWQSSPDGSNWTDMTGLISNTATISQTTSTYYRARVSCGSNTSYSTTLQVPVYFSTIATEPADATAICGSSALFYATISGNSPITSYQWQEKTSLAGAWTNISNSPVIKGTNDDSLFLMQMPSSWDGYQFRLQFKDACGIIHTTDSALLTVNPFTADISPSSSSTCSGQITALNLQGSQTKVSTFSSPTLSLLIPDTLKAGVTDSINVSGIPSNAVISALSVKFNIAHTWAGDLAISLKAPNGKVINLNYFLSETGGPGITTTGFTNTLIGSNGSVSLGDGTDPWTGYFRADGIITPPGSPDPSGPSSMLANTGRWDSLWLIPNGSWKIGLYDGSEGDEGTLSNWSLQFTYSTPVTAGWTSTAAGSLFSNAAATIPYSTGTQASSVYVNTNTSATVTATPTSALCGTGNSSSATITVGVPTGTITGPVSTQACPGTSANFTATVSAGTGLSYQWQVSTDGGATWNNIPGADSLSYTKQNVSSADNNKKFRLQITNPCSASPSISSTALLTVGSAPNITQQPVNTNACIGGGAILHAATSDTAATFQWQASIDGGISWSNITPGGNSASLNLSGLTAADNFKQFRVLVTDCGITTASNAAVLTVVPSGSISVQPANVSACAGDNAVMVATATGSGYQWQLSTNNGSSWSNIAGANNPTLDLTAVTTSQNGNLYRLLVGDCGVGTITSNSAMLTVNSRAVITAQPSGTNVCEGTATGFSISATGSPISYQWQVSTDGGTTWANISGATASSYNIASTSIADNNKRFRVRVSSAAPCSPVLSDAVTLVVKVNPLVSATAVPSTRVCLGTSVTLTGSGASSYSWDNGISNGTAFPANSSGVYIVTGTENGCSDTASVSITVLPNPVVTVTASNGTELLPGGSTLLSAQSNPAAASFQWFKEGVIMAGMTGSSLTVTYNSSADLGNYTAEAADANGCKGTSSAVLIEAYIAPLITPNPASGSFYVTLPPANTNLSCTVNVYDSKGARVFSARYSGPANAMKVNATSFSTGVYMVEVKDENGKRIGSGKVLITAR